MKKNLISIAVIASFLGLQAALAMVSEQTQQAAVSLGASSLGEVEFVAGSDAVSEASRAELKNIIDDARQKGKIDNIKVLAWSDQEYPAAKTAQSKEEIQLARKRLASLQKYLKGELKITNVDGFNMAERPTKLKEFFNTQDARVKKTTEIAGAAPATDADTGLFGEKGQASKAVIMVFTKK